MKNLTTAIYGKMTSSTALYADIGGRLYKGEAEQGADFPYIVFMVVSNVPEYPGGKTIERVLLQFSLFSAASGSTEIETMLTDLRALFDDCSLSPTSETLIYFIRGNMTEMRDEVTTPSGTVGAWHFVQEYEVEIVRT